MDGVTDIEEVMAAIESLLRKGLIEVRDGEIVLADGVVVMAAEGGKQPR